MLRRLAPALACALLGAAAPGAARAQATPDSAARRDSARALAPVVVQETARATARRYGARRTTSATKTDTPLRDVPQAVTVLGQALLKDQAMQNMADVVRYVPGVTMAQGEGHRDAPVIRGQSSTADFFVDGVRDDAQYLRDVYNVERVEALKGANAMVFGRGGGGGVINRVSKEASWTPLREATVEGGTFDHLRATLDVGGAADGRAATRLNALSERTAGFRDHGSVQRLGVNPTGALLLGGTMVRAGYERFEDRRTVDRGVPSLAAAMRPWEGSRTRFFGDPSANEGRTTVDMGTATVERGSADGVLLRNRTRLARYDKFYQNVFAGSAVDSLGVVRLSAYNHAIDRHNAFNQTDLTWAVGGRVRHTLLAGAELSRQQTTQFRNTGYFGGASSTQTSLAVNAADPDVASGVTFRQSATDANSRATASVLGVYAQDQLAFGRFVQAVVGVRQDRFALAYFNERTRQRLTRVDQLLSPRVGLVLKPATPLSLYGAWSVSHLPASGDQFTALTVTTATLRPERFANREAGVKWEPRDDLALTGAVYRVDRTNTTAPDPADPSRVVQTGAQRTTGWELGVTGAPLAAWQVAGGVARQTARIVSRTTAANAGASVPLVPGTTASLWNRVQLTRALGAGLGVVHQTRMFAAIDNTVALPGFTRLDAAAYLPLAPGVRAQVNVENLLDRAYFATSHGNNNIMPGAPRTVRLSVTMLP